ncbi:MAG: thioesterase family protein [Pseudomonadales bacterium]|jgi:acyl-CoA thioester hydrolase|nr:thioesterase family protein [Pseudomonadales bacterium]
MSTAPDPVGAEVTRGDFPFACLFRVRYSEIDGQQIVFNAHYLTWMDTALAEYLRHLGIVYGDAREGAEPVDFHTVRNLIDYHAPVRFDEVIAVCCRPGRIGRSSITFEMAIFARGDGAARATGQVVWVCAGIGDHASRPIPDDMRARFDAARDAEPVEVDPVRV